MKRKPSTSLTVILRLILLVVIPALSFVLFEAGWRRLEQRRRFPLSQQLPLPLDVLPLRVHSLLLPRICKNKLMRSFLCTNWLSLNVFVPVCVLTWWGSGRRIHQSTARWRTLRAARWWSGPGAGGPACSCPYKPSSPALTTKTGNSESTIITAKPMSSAQTYKERETDTTNLLDKELLAHGHALVEPLLVAL